MIGLALWAMASAMPSEDLTAIKAQWASCLQKAVEAPARNLKIDPDDAAWQAFPPCRRYALDLGRRWSEELAQLEAITHSGKPDDGSYVRSEMSDLQNRLANYVICVRRWGRSQCRKI